MADGCKLTASLMVRDLGRLTATEHDLLVIGGGISGLIAAYDAAQRGLAVALIERGDFGAATSFNHSKIVHGGLRYLQGGDLGRMRRSVLERRALATIAPHLVIPLAFLAPTTRTAARGRLAFTTAFTIDAWIGRDRNAGVRADLHLPAGRVTSLRECRQLAPELDLDGATGGALWYDYQMPFADRLTLAFALAAHAHGAALSNYVEAVAPIRRKDAIAGVTARDLGGRQEPFEIRARVTLNASGPWARSVMAWCGIERSVPLLKAINFVTSRPASGPALVRSNPEGRALVLTPWRGRALIGTGESAASGGPDHSHVSEEELATFVRDVNATFRTLNLRPDEVRLVHRGAVPAVIQNGRMRLKAREEVIDHSRDGIEGLVTAIGVKYTTARFLAEQAIDLAITKLGRSRVSGRTTLVPLPGVPAEGATLVASLLQRHGNWLEEAIALELAAAHGTGGHAIAAMAEENPALRERITPSSPVLRAEIVHVVRQEMALTLTDVVARRTSLGTAGHPGSAVARACAEILRKELNWTPERVSQEIDALRAFYDPVARTER